MDITNPQPTVDMLEDVTPDKAEPATMDAATLLKLIIKEGKKIGKSQKANRETIQNWLVCAGEFKGEDLTAILSRIMDLTEDWHGMNVKRLEKCVRDGVKGAKLSKKENGWTLVCKPQSIKRISFAVPGEWYLYDPETVAKDIPLAEALAKFISQREKKGDDINAVAKALEDMLAAE